MFTLANVQHFPSVRLQLTEVNSPAVPAKSGLNWGQRSRREPNQAYLSVPIDVRRAHPGFFPPRKQRFTLYTDDGQQMDCVMAQDNNKAIETPDNNSTLGKYFRKRLGVPMGQRVYAHDLANYGRSDVVIYKISNTEYFLDFHV